MSARPRRHAHRGSVLAAGFAIDPRAAGARDRVLALWAPGCDVRVVDGAWLVRLATPRRIAVADAPGAPLVAQHGVLAALPLTAAEVAAVGAAPGSAIVARGGALVAIDAAHGELIDPASWLDVGALAVLDAAPLAAPPVAPSIPVAIQAAEVRAALGFGPPSPEALAVRAALTGEPMPEERAAGEGAAVEGAAPPGWWSRWWQALRARRGERVGGAQRETATRAGWWSRWWQALRGRGAGPSRALPASGGASAPPETPAAPPRPSWLERLRVRVAVALWTSPLGQAIGRRHADYLRETLELFDRGRLDEALRRAIPLDAGARPGPGHLALGLPTPRTSLGPTLRAPGGGGAVVPLVESAMQALRARYLAARDRLVREGRIDEAAFVLADLLDDPAAAVELLERRGRTRLAAELAEARRLAPGLVIRQWFVAGDRDRAIQLAWRTGAFADALARAGKTPVADRMRLAWADALAGAGDYLAAIDVLAELDEPVAAADALIDRWIELGLATGGVVAARLWIRRLARAADRLAEVRAAVVPILAGGDDVLAERIAIAQELVAAPHGPATAALARAAARAMIADLGRGVDGEPATLLPRLLRVAGDAALRADMPALGKLPPRPALVRPALHRWARGDAGAIVVHDVVPVPGGRVLVALGELGVRLFTADGRTVAAWDQPADALVIADHGATAIALARRGRTQRLARIDLARRTMRPWCEAELDGWMATFDGAMWFVTRGADLLGLDATRAELRAMWGVTADRGGVWRGLARAGDRWGAIHGEPVAAEAWLHERLTLRARRTIEHAAPGCTDVLVASSAAPDGDDWVRAIYQLDDTTGALAPHLVGPGWRHPLAELAGDPPARLTSLAVGGGLVAVTAGTAEGVVVEIVEPPGDVVARLVLGGARQARVRLHGHLACAGDDRGRAVLVDLRTGALRSDLRLR